jgi:hypothetical protein
MEWKGQRLGIVETRPHYTIILKESIRSNHKQQLVTQDDPQELFAILIL